MKTFFLQQICSKQDSPKLLWLVFLVLLLDDNLLIHCSVLFWINKKRPTVIGGALTIFTKQAQLPDDVLVSVLLLCLFQGDCAHFYLHRAAV
ncbi:hypothetical protein [Candidatus Leptofilum sp.]|uniref:hypothetical protein n=1 Tax=Candidatus Leptofilum sp. TaxID=3241576 RepID=UPI003B5CB50D